jgi:methionyl-tRNA formyltransferase
MKIKKKVLLCCRNECEYSNKLISFLKKKNIDLKIFFSKRYKEKIPKILIKTNYDLILNFRSYLILNKKILNNCKIAVNFHPSLPKYRGVGGANYAIINKDKNFGSTAHIIDDKIDHGRIIDIKKFKINKNIKLKDLINKTHKNMLLQAMKLFKDILLNEDKLLKKINKCKIKWSKNYGDVKKLNDFYTLKIDVNKSFFKRYINATVFNSFIPKVEINGVKFNLIVKKN